MSRIIKPTRLSEAFGLNQRDLTAPATAGAYAETSKTSRTPRKGADREDWGTEADEERI